MNIVISGATRGIGKAITLAFVRNIENGNRLFLIARNEKKLNALKKHIETVYPKNKVSVYATDIRIKKNIKEVTDNILFVTKYKVNVLINNAGIFSPSSLCSPDETDILEKTLAVNLYSAYYLTQFLLPGMIDRKSGFIFNMCSVASLQPYPNGGVYSISKYALLGYSENLREELKPYNIKVVAVCPGATFTDSWKGSDIPKQRMMEVEDIAKMVYQVTQLSDRAVVERIVMRPQLGDL